MQYQWLIRGKPSSEPVLKLKGFPGYWQTGDVILATLILAGLILSLSI